MKIGTIVFRQGCLQRTGEGERPSYGGVQPGPGQRGESGGHQVEAGRRSDDEGLSHITSTSIGSLSRWQLLQSYEKTHSAFMPFSVLPPSRRREIASLLKAAVDRLLSKFKVCMHVIKT